MSGRDPASVAFEVEYWQAAIADLAELNTLVASAAAVLVDVPVALVTLGVSAPEHLRADVEAASVAAKGTMDVLGRMHGPIFRLIELAAGRVRALEAEL